MPSVYALHMNGPQTLWSQYGAAAQDKGAKKSKQTACLGERQTKGE
jgi:hypothetical protein